MGLNSRAFRNVILLGLTCLALYVLVRRSGAMQNSISRRDSIQYWAGARLLLNHENPYDSSRVLKLEKLQGYNEDRPLVIRTPPWSLFMFLPLGFLNAFWAWILWFAASVASLIIAMRISWRLYGQQGAQSIFALVGYTFAPVPACLVAGQMGFLLLLGLILFLWVEGRRPFLAGAALILPFAKPHLLVLFWITLVLWILWERKYRIASGLVAVLVPAVALAFAFDISVFRDYHDFISQAAIGHELIPALSGVIRALFFHRMFWIQFVPLSLGSIWCVWYFFKNRKKWDWRSHGLAVMVVSILVTPYSWITDEVVLLPAVLQAAIWAYGSRQRIRIGTGLAILAFVCLNLLLLLILSSTIPFSSGIYFWSSLVWFGWYFYARRLWSPDLISTEAGPPNLTGVSHPGW